MAGRKVKRNTKAIKRWMLDNDITVTTIQNALNYSRHCVVSNTLCGRVDNRKVLIYLLEKGCPAKFLALPEGMKEAA